MECGGGLGVVSRVLSVGWVLDLHLGLGVRVLLGGKV
jgi:hypothetical protein